LIEVFDSTYSSSGKSRANIKVVGVGGGGNNAVDRMIEDQLYNVDFVSVNTDHQVLERSMAGTRIQIGDKLTRGLGAGGDPVIGRNAAEETKDEIQKAIMGTDLLFITAGMGGGTGTGAAPVIAEIAKEMNIRTVAVVTKPFNFEGRPRMTNATNGITELKKHVDTLVVIPNQNLMEIVTKDTSFKQALKKADEILCQGVQAISDLITKDGIINVDFADVSTIMQIKGIAHMGVGRASGKNRTDVAAEMAIKSPLLETSINGAKSVLISIAGAEELGLMEASSAAEIIGAVVDPNANIIFGTTINTELGDEVVITVFATGLEQNDSFIPAQRPSQAQAQQPQEPAGSDSQQGRPPLDSPVKVVRNYNRAGTEEEPFEIPIFLQNRK